MRGQSKYFVHPEDQAALEQLEAIPLFPECVKAFLKFFPERSLHGLNMAEKIRLGPRQLPDIYRHLPVAVDALNIDEPEFYLEMNPIPNAYTMGDSQIAVTVTSGLLEMMNPEEVQAVIAHECGHIACRHTLYRTMARLLARFGTQILGPLAALSAPVQIALAYWTRRSELSADRAGAFVMRSPRPMMDAMIRLAGGSRTLTGSINFELYMEQTQEYDKLLESTWDKVLQGLAVMQRDHPLNSVRCRELHHWCGGDEFQRLLQGLDQQAVRGRCPTCGRAVEDDWKFCRGCGKPIALDFNRSLPENRP
jgi:Zn-dependent protease with chaperone function